MPFYELPPQKFEACRRLSTFPDKHLLVRVDTNRYSIPTEYAYRSCQIKVFVDRVDIYFSHELIASHKKCYLKEQYILDPLHYIKLLERKPGSLDNARAFSDEAVSSFLRHDGHLDLGGNRVLVNQGDGKRNLGIYESLSREGCLV